MGYWELKTCNECCCASAWECSRQMATEERLGAQHQLVPPPYQTASTLISCSQASSKAFPWCDGQSRDRASCR